MTGNIKVNWKRLILAMMISIGAGVISWLLTGNSMEIYRDLNKPVLSPPGQLFPNCMDNSFYTYGTGILYCM